MKRFEIIIITVVAVLFISTSVGYFLLSSPPPPESPALGATSTEPPASPPKSTPSIKPSAPPSESTPPSGQPPSSFEQKMENLREAIADVCATGESREVTVVFTEAEANDQAAKRLAQAEIPEDIPLEVSSVHIDFQTDNNLLTEAKTVAYGFIKFTIKVKAQVGIEAGKPRVEVTKVSFGFVPLPKLLKDRITGLITQQIDGLLSQIAGAQLGCNGKAALEFADIDTQESTATITVIIKPEA